jgi:hypothetical protein
VFSTGTDYTTKDLATKALALTGAAATKRANAPAAGAPQNDTSSVAGGASAAAAPAAPSASPAVPVPAPSGAQTLAALGSTAASAEARTSAKVTGNTTLTDPAALQACLATLGVKNAQPLAVDLASYQGRDAAIIVLAARDGGYEVWAVERTCAPGNGGQLDYKAVPPS